MTLDPNRWADPAAYLAGDLRARAVSVQAEINLVRDALLVASATLNKLRDDWRIKLWEQSVAAQDRAITVETRIQSDIVEQTEADLQQLLDERDLLMVLIAHAT